MWAGGEGGIHGVGGGIGGFTRKSNDRAWVDEFGAANEWNNGQDGCLHIE